jgi:glycosyltransferase involved in cell wall biosynthesis
MKLAILTAQISPYHNARYVKVAENFDDIHILSFVNQGDFDEFLAKSLGGYQIHYICNGRDDYETAVSSLTLRKRMQSVFDDLKPDAIAVAGWSAPESLIALEYGRQSGIPTVVMSESQADDAPRSALREFIKGRIVSQFDGALVGGPPHADYVVKLGMPRERIFLGYNAVDNTYFQREAARAKASHEQIRVRYNLPHRYLLASARFIRKKNLVNLIEAFSYCRRTNPNTPDLVILGDGPERPEIEHSVQANNVSDFVHLPGFRGYDVLPAYYSLSEGFLHVSSTEQWGLVINEAMASGVPVIASHPCGAARTLIDDSKNGILTGIDVTSIADAILRLCGMSNAERNAMGLSAQETIHEWGPNRFADGLMNAVERAMLVPRRGPLGLFDAALVRRLQRNFITRVQ